MRLIEKSLTENIYNALNESSDQNKATKRAARYKKSNRVRMNESEEEQLNDLYNADKVEWDDLSGSDQTAVEYFSSNFGDNIAGKSWDEVESDIIEACYDIGYANEELINSGYWMDGDMDPEPDEKKVTDYIFQNYFLPKKNSKNMNESFDPDKTAKRVARYKEFDNGHVFHSWLEDKTADEVEELARLASIKNPNDVYYVQYDDVMNGSEYRYVNGVQYDINKGGFHWVNGLPKFHTDADWQAVSKREKTWEEIDAMNEDVAIDNDPDLDADQVQADVDYWTDVDEANTEDVSNMKPIGVYTISNNSAIYVYQIEYDIEDRVLVGDSSDETKAKWRDIIYDDRDAYFWYGDIKIPFNDVVKTDM